jgi:hypothetical protein
MQLPNPIKLATPAIICTFVEAFKFVFLHCMRWTIRGFNPRGARFSTPFQTAPGDHPPSCTVGTSCLSLGWIGRSFALATHPNVAPRLYIRTAVLYVYFPFVPQMACDRVTFTFTLQLVKFSVDSACYGEARETLFGNLIRPLMLVCHVMWMMLTFCDHIYQLKSY